MFSIPTLPQLYSRWMGWFRAFANLDAGLPMNNVAPLAKVGAGRDNEIFGHIDYIANQRFVRTADEASLGEHAYQFNVPRLPALPAKGHVDIISGGDLLVPANTVFTRADSAQYISTAAGSLSAAGTLTVAATAMAAGGDSNAVADTPLSIGDGVTGSGASTATAAVAADGIAFGADIEDIEAWRGRILFRLRFPPHGGAAPDYVMWARKVPGVTRVYVERLYRGPGTVRVFPIFDDFFAATGGVATDAYILAVAAAIEEEEPATALVTVSAPAPQIINIVATGVAPYTATVREAIAAELRDMMVRFGAVAGSDSPRASMPFLATPQTFSRSWIWQAIANASSEQRHVLVTPAADIPIAPGAIPVLGTVSLFA